MNLNPHAPNDLNNCVWCAWSSQIFCSSERFTLPSNATPRMPAIRHASFDDPIEIFFQVDTKTEKIILTAECSAGSKVETANHPLLQVTFPENVVCFFKRSRLLE